jgi:2-polyprenyl-3-methyl-5-hydroxy-6-metoxy-1,4-benzoquinol methylase
MLWSHRCLQPEVMDQPDLDQARHWQALHGLERINWLSNSAGILWPSIRRLALEVGDRPLHILDVACGAGDVNIALSRKAARAGLQITCEGADISVRAVEYARQQADAAQAPIRFFQMDALADDFPNAYDVVFSSLFLHHLHEEQAVILLGRMAQASRKFVLISDLVRSRLAWTAAFVVTRLMTRSDVVHIDGPLSARAAFTPKEALALAHRAGLEGAMVVRRWPFRFLLSWNKESRNQGRKN